MDSKNIFIRPLQTRRAAVRQSTKTEESIKHGDFLDALNTLKPDFTLHGSKDNQLPPIEGRFKHPIASSRVRFQYTKPVYVQNSESITEDDILRAVLFPKRHNGHKHNRVLDDIRANISPEVKEYWLQKMRDSELRRGRLYIKED